MGTVMVLRPALPLDGEEALLSYADRLSLMHTNRGMERLLADRGIHKEHFVSGRPDAVAMFAEAIGQSVDALHPFVGKIFQRRFCHLVLLAIAPVPCRRRL
jgi:hypothetical protein